MSTNLLQVANSGILELAMYTPILNRRWNWRFQNDNNALFIAPIIKLGPIGLSGDHDNFRNERIDARDNVYAYWSGGFRFGHVKLDAQPRSVAPQLLSYLDVTFGKFDNFRTPYLPTGCVATPPADTILNPPCSDDRFRRDWRADFHGRFKIPETPLYVGFSSNIGGGPDDLRFFFGTRFDIGEVIRKAIPALRSGGSTGSAQ